jgi:hypothetical protein
MPDSVAFVLPTLPSSDMAKDDQGALIVNQAAAAIVSAWLGHANTCVQNGITGGTGQFTVTRSDLVLLINDVQTALRSF